MVAPRRVITPWSPKYDVAVGAGPSSRLAPLGVLGDESPDSERSMVIGPRSVPRRVGQIEDSGGMELLLLKPVNLGPFRHPIRIATPAEYVQ
jgi:hypothetical protein